MQRPELSNSYQLKLIQKPQREAYSCESVTLRKLYEPHSSDPNYPQFVHSKDPETVLLQCKLFSKHLNIIRHIWQYAVLSMHGGLKSVVNQV